MTENQERPTPYTEFRDSFPIGEDADRSPKMAVLWRSADRWRAHLRDQIADIQEDAELSEEGKQARIQSAYDRLAPKIEQESKQAKEKARNISEAAERRSIPGVPNASVESDPAVRNNVMLEAQEIRERAKRIEESTPEFAKAGGRILDMLRDEYAEAIETGGLGGATTCQAVLRAAKVLGVNEEEVYSHLREQKHLDALEEARRYAQAYQTIPTNVPSLDRGKVYGNHWKKGGTPRVFIPKGGPIAGGGGKRKPSWK